MLQRPLAGARLLPQMYSGYKEAHCVFQYWQNVLFPPGRHLETSKSHDRLYPKYWMPANGTSTSNA
jgi:hypothetical protein